MTQINTTVGNVPVPNYGNFYKPSNTQPTKGLLTPPGVNNFSLGGLVKNVGNFMGGIGNYVNSSAQRGNQIVQQGQTNTANSIGGVNTTPTGNVNTSSTSLSSGTPSINYSKMQSIPGQSNPISGIQNKPLIGSQNQTDITGNNNANVNNTNKNITNITPSSDMNHPGNTIFYSDGSQTFVPGSNVSGVNDVKTSPTENNFPSYVNKLGNPNYDYGQYQAPLANAANNPNIQNANANIQALQNQYANANAQIMGGQGLTQQTAQGREGVLQNLYANQLSAAEQALSNAQTQAGLQQTGYQQAGAMAQNTQALNQQAINSAAGYAQPQLSEYGQGYYNPLQANQATGGQPIGGNYGTGVVAAANAQSVKQLQGQLNIWDAASNNAKAIVEQQLTPLLNNSRVNPSNINLVNSLLKTIANNTSDPRYSNLQNIISELSASYASVLTQPNGNQTNLQTQIAQGLLDSSMQGKGIQDVIKQLDATVESKTNATKDTINKLSNQGGSQNSNNTNSGNTFGNFFGNQ